MNLWPVYTIRIRDRSKHDSHPEAMENHYILQNAETGGELPFSFAARKIPQ